MFPLNLYAHVRFLLMHIAHETAGAARTRSSPRPLLRVALRPLVFEGETNLQNSGASCRGNAHARHRPRSVRTIQHSETSVMESRTRGVLNTRLRGYDGGGWSDRSPHKRSDMRVLPRSRMLRSLSSGVHSRDPLADASCGLSSAVVRRELYASAENSAPAIGPRSGLTSDRL